MTIQQVLEEIYITLYYDDHTFFCQSYTFKIIKVSIMISFVPSPTPSHPLQSFIHQLNSLWPFQYPTIIHVKHMLLSLYSLLQNFMVSYFNIFSTEESSTAPFHV
jgi:hypothetical protein